MKREVNKIMITQTEIDVLIDWFNRGIQLVPYKLEWIDGKKKPVFPDFWCWKTKPDKSRIKSDRQIYHFAYDNWKFAFRLEDANATMADFDNLLPFTDADLNQSGMELGDFVQHKKHEFQSMSETARSAMIIKRIKSAEATFNKVCPVISSSDKSVHIYQRAKGTPFHNIHTSHIEVFSNNKLGFVADWEGMQDFWQLPIYDYEDIGNYWIQINNELQQGLANITPITLNAPTSSRLSGSFGRRITKDQWASIFKSLRLDDPDLQFAIRAELLCDGLTEEQIDNKFEFAQAEIDNQVPFHEKIKTFNVNINYK